MMSDRKEGWYWVKLEFPNQAWEVCLFDGKDWWETCEDCPVVPSKIKAIGPRIPTPDEMEGWQVVPKEDTTEITLASIDFTNGKRTHKSRWQQMLSAAPKPGDVWSL